MNREILQACNELIDDARMGCADLVFKEVCLEILSRASHVLTKRQFKQLVTYAAGKMREKNPVEIEHELVVNR